MLRSTQSGLRVSARAAGLVAGLAASTVLLVSAAAAQEPAERSGLDPALLGGWSAPSADGPRLRVLSDEPTSVTVEVTATWSMPLADALAYALASGVAPVALVGAAVMGRATLSYEVALGARVPPAVEVVSEDVEWVALSAGQAEALAALAAPAARVENVGELRRELVGSLAVRLLRVDGERLGRVRRVVLRVPRPALRVAFARGGTPNPHVAVTRSVLADGQWFRVPVAREGVYRLTAAYLRDSLGVAGADLNRVQVYGNGGRILPAVTSAPRPADLMEVPTLVSGDAVLFFAEGPSWWNYVPSLGTTPGRWEHDISPFSDETHYFVRVDAPAPRRLAAEAFPGWPDAERLATVTSRQFHERDRYNQERDGSGSGLDWMGEEIARSAAGTTFLDGAAPSGITGPVRYRARVAARSNVPTTVTMTSAGQTLATITLSAVVTNASNLDNLLSDRTVDVERPASADLGVTFRASGGAADGRAFLDWVEAVAERTPAAQGGAVRFVTPGGRTGRFEVALEGFASAPEVWDVTEAGSIRRLGVQAAGGAFVVQVEAAGRPREIVAFDAGGAYVSALSRGGTPVANQNLHGLAGSPAYVVVVHPDFAAQAERLAAYRRQHDGLETVVVTTDQVNNEFAAGSTDMRAMRDYMKFLYDRAPDAARLPRYLLLFGDGHFDFRNIGTEVPNFVPVYETENMFNRTNSYTSDDYFGVLADGDGQWNNNATNERVQVGIGRLPVRTAEEAENLVDKIELYESPATQGDWRTRATFVGDDQYPNDWDKDLHVLNANGTAERLARTDSTITLQKIYAPSYPRVTTAVGARRPAATEAVIRSLNEGTLIWNYSGHGSPENLGDERYFTEDVLTALDNRDRPSIFVTATCSFGKFDIDEEQSMAERVLLLPEGGGIAMFTTVRVVYTSSSPTDVTNYGLNLTLTEEMVSREAGGRPQRLGDILYQTKNTDIGASLNNRKFNLLGDPAMRIGLPERRIAIDAPAAFRAFEEATVSGQVLGPDGQPDAAFAGEVDVEVFDALRIVRMPPTPEPNLIPFFIPRGEYTLQTDALYAGRATVSAGRFSATFRVPQDVSYSGLPAKVVAYARGAGVDGVGASSRAVVSAEAGTRPDDGAGPTVRLFLDDTTFVSGGLARATPVLIARLNDASGINTVGAGVGHELLLTIDGDAATAVDVGRYYTGDLDTYRSGTVRFPLARLAPGPHTARLTAWDAVNNASSAEVAFTVTDAQGLEVRNVFPYPNPTAGPTRFTFEHNLPAGTVARVQVRIFSLAGRPVRTIAGDEALPGGVLPGGLVQIPWDGRDDDLDRLATGIYLYRLRIEADAADGRTETVERVERLAIIR